MSESFSKFIIRRKDAAQLVDDLVIESDSLLIGRLFKNDLVLNNRAVSRSHAGIKQIGKDYWIYNLSASNGTVLNGELVERTPLVDNDIIQIGPFLLKVNYTDDALTITVERELEVSPAKGQAGQTGLLAQTGLLSMPAALPDEGESTVPMNLPAKIGQPVVTPGGTQRLSVTGMLRTALPGMNERALKLFWDKRQREAGKLQEETPLHPKGALKFGKAQYNWSPTLDLRKLWRKSYWYWGALVVAALAAVAAFAYPDTYSPGEVSTAHTKSAVSAPGVAFRANANSCNECHNVAVGVQNKCIECHNTAAAPADSQNAFRFSPQTLIGGHVNANVTACNLCHTEHQGRESEAGLLNYALCVNCHNGEYTIEAGINQGKKLPVPHGGANIGLPQLGVDYKWAGWTAARWQQSLERWENRELRQAFTPQKLEATPPVGYVKNDQFHFIHYLGRVEDKESCIVCHKDARGNLYLDARSAEGIRNLRAACLKCHASNETASSQIGGVTTQLANCITCHKQHPTDSPLAADAQGAQGLRSLSKVLAAVAEEKKANRDGRFLTFAGTGSATTIRQEQDMFRLDPDSDFGAVPLFGWVATLFALPALTLIGLAIGTARRKYQLNARVAAKKSGTAAMDPKAKVTERKKQKQWEDLKAKWLASVPVDDDAAKAKVDLNKIVAEGPRYAYPVVNPFTCIGCHACVEACPADVLEIVNGISMPVRADQCMDDTGCQVACPTNPKSCIVINTGKMIPPREVPARDARLETNVKGVYMVGDVSGVPLIKNAINEGALVMDKIQEDLKAEGARPDAEYDVAIIGVGPGGLSAAVIAKQRGLSYVAVEQGKIVDTIQQAYPAGKYVFYKPDTMVERGGIPLPGPGDTKEMMLKGWFDAMMQNQVMINEDEMCKSIKQENGVFVVSTERGDLGEQASYRARRVVIAIGNRGTPMKLRVPGEELKITVQPPPQYAKFCNRCGNPRRQGQKFCNTCGEKINVRLLPPTEDSKVKYRLADPDDFVGKKCIVVGAGNSAIEAAVDLAGLKRDGDKITFTRDNQVTLVIRSDLKGDLKLGNKMNLFDCVDAGRIKTMYRTQIKEIHEREVVLMDGSGKETARIENDYIFALIGGDKPTKFLKDIGITIEGEKQ